MSKWVILDGTGAIFAQINSDGSPKDNPTITLPDGATAIEVPRFGDLSREKMVNGAWVADMTPIRARLLDQVDDRRETEQMKWLTPGGAKKMIYVQKAAEVRDYRALGSAALALLNLTDRRARFPAAFAEMDATGDTLAAVIARFEAAANSANAKVYKLEALAQKAKAAIRAATTEAAAIAAAAVNWTV